MGFCLLALAAQVGQAGYSNADFNALWTYFQQQAGPTWGGIVTVLSQYATYIAAVGQGTDSGTITGTVNDASGAVVPGAKVSIENPISGLKRSATTDGLAAHLEAWSGIDISPWWARYVHGRG